jgi:ABC-type lipoprotein export system ATPase subunit
MIELVEVQQIYQDGLSKNHILHNINLHIAKDDFVTIMGPSGCGKSTLLNILSLLTRPTKGEVIFHDKSIRYHKEKELENLRKNNIGLVFQNANLISCLSPLENLMLALHSKDRYLTRKKRAMELLDQVGLSDKYNTSTKALSGGEAQRVSIVRALINEPELLLCDEPTGALDANNADNVIQLLTRLQKEKHCALIIVTHDQNIGKLGDRQIRLKGGRIDEMDSNL